MLPCILHMVYIGIACFEVKGLGFQGWGVGGSGCVDEEILHHLEPFNYFSSRV